MAGDPRARQVELVLGRLTTLPTLSPIAQRLLSISSGDDFDLREVTRLIEADPSTSARILALCRRAELGLGDRITTVKRAILMLGMDAVRSAVLSVSIYDAMEEAAGGGEDEQDADGPFDRRGFWRHAVGVASCAEMLARQHKSLGVNHDEAFVGGLLHDLGRLALQVALPRAMARVIQLAEHRQCDSAPLERQIIGIDHHLAGRRVAQRWELPEALSNVMWLHGQPSSAVPDVPDRNLVCLVTIARQICRQLHIGWSGDFGEGIDLPREAELLGLVATRVEKIRPRLHEEVAARCAAIGIGDESSPQLLLQSIQLANERLVRANDLLRERMERANRSGRAVEAISAFQRSLRPGMGVDETLEAVLASAQRELGAPLVAGAFGDERGEARLMIRQEDAPVEEVRLAPEMPADAAFLEELKNLQRGARRIAPPDALLDCVPALLDEPLLAMRLLPGRGGRPLAAIIGPELGGLDESLAPLADAWTLALGWAVEHEHGRDLGEKLVEANRALSEAQAQLTRVESLRRLAEMTAGAAHEMNNPLMVISGRAQLLAMRTEGPGREMAEEVIGAAEELTELVTSLNLLANPPRPSRCATSARAVAEAALLVVANLRGGCEAQRVRVEAPELAVSGDEQMLAQCVAELVLNALEATDGADVTITAEMDPLDGRLLVRVADRGRGMSPRALEHAFDPFFSEREAGRGRGLGLARARRLAELHGGEVLLRSERGAGTTATLALPADPAGREQRAA